MSEPYTTTEIPEKNRRRRSVVNVEEEFTTARDEVNERISYPVQSCSRGEARISHGRKAFYFGRFDSGPSYVLFGLWKTQLMLLGEPVPCKSLRPIAAAAIRGGVFTPPKALHTAWVVSALVACCLSIAAANYFGYRFYSSYKPTEVDGRVLSESEVAIIQGTRRANAEMEALRTRNAAIDSSELFAETLERVRKQIQASQAMEGNPNATPTDESPNSDRIDAD